MKTLLMSKPCLLLTTDFWKDRTYQASSRPPWQSYHTLRQCIKSMFMSSTFSSSVINYLVIDYIANKSIITLVIVILLATTSVVTYPLNGHLLSWSTCELYVWSWTIIRTLCIFMSYQITCIKNDAFTGHLLLIAYLAQYRSSWETLLH